MIVHGKGGGGLGKGRLTVRWLGGDSWENMNNEHPRREFPEFLLFLVFSPPCILESGGVDIVCKDSRQRHWLATGRLGPEEICKKVKLVGATRLDAATWTGE